MHKFTFNYFTSKQGGAHCALGFWLVASWKSRSILSCFLRQSKGKSKNKEKKKQLYFTFNSHLKVQEHNQIPALTMFDIVQGKERRWLVAKYGDPYLELCALHLTHPSAHTHTAVSSEHTQWAANAAAPGEQLGVRCLAQGSHLSRGIEPGESAGHSLPPPTIPAGPETRTRDLQVTSPSL